MTMIGSVVSFNSNIGIVNFAGHLVGFGMPVQALLVFIPRMARVTGVAYASKASGLKDILVSHNSYVSSKGLILSETITSPNVRRFLERGGCFWCS